MANNEVSTQATPAQRMEAIKLFFDFVKSQPEISQRFCAGKVLSGEDVADFAIDGAKKLLTFLASGN
jgi:hypothetical protein